jgi:hypothetical protein
MISKGISIAGQTLSVDPRTGRLENLAKPFGKAAANIIAPDHTILVTHSDGTERKIVIKGATYSELRDQDFILALVSEDTNDWDRWLTKRRVTNEQWHSYVITLADKHPDKVKVADCIKRDRPRIDRRDTWDRSRGSWSRSM